MERVVSREKNASLAVSPHPRQSTDTELSQRTIKSADREAFLERVVSREKSASLSALAESTRDMTTGVVSPHTHAKFAVREKVRDLIQHFARADQA